MVCDQDGVGAWVGRQAGDGRMWVDVWTDGWELVALDIPTSNLILVQNTKDVHGNIIKAWNLFRVPDRAGLFVDCREKGMTPSSKTRRGYCREPGVSVWRGRER